MARLAHMGALAVWLLAGCAGSTETAAQKGFDAVPRPTRFDAPDPSRSRAGRTDGDGSLGGPEAASGSLGQYLAWAFEHSPSVRAAHARWEAAMHRVSKGRRLPEPVLSFGVFLQAVETRVGPQRARIGIQQTFPWPSKLSAGADAAAFQTRAAGRRFEATALKTAQMVEAAYWSLWEIRHTRAIHMRHLQVVKALSETVRARIVTGAATLADQQQIDLTAARLEDNIRSMTEAETTAAAQLRAVVGLPVAFDVPTGDDPPEPSVPKADLATLSAEVRAHPAIEAIEEGARAQDAQADAEAADRLPSFTVGADWIITDEARMPNVVGSGKDAVIAGVGVRLPLWQGNYADSEAAARAEALSQRAEREAAVDAALAELSAAHSALRDSARRAWLYRGTLLPQADSAYASVLGAYTAGRGTVAQTLLSQRDLLDLRVDLERARADHMRAWARMQQVVGQALDRAPYQPPEATVTPGIGPTLGDETSLDSTGAERPRRARAGFGPPTTVNPTTGDALARHLSWERGGSSAPEIKQNPAGSSPIPLLNPSGDQHE